mgnify:FL=1
MQEEQFGPCTVVGWCTGHPSWESQAGDETIHSAAPSILVARTADLSNPAPEELAIERQLLAAEGHEFFHMYGNISHMLDVDDLEPLASQFEAAAAQLRRLAKSIEVENAREIRR